MSFLLLTSITTFGQPINGSDWKNKTGLNYWQLIQIDSSEYFIIEKRIDKSESAMYRTKLDYFGNPSYCYLSSNKIKSPEYTDIQFA